MRIKRIFVALLCIASLSGIAAAQQNCEVVASEHVEWLSNSLKAWKTVRKNLLRLPAGPLPWMVLFDETCVINIRPGEPLTSANRYKLNGEWTAMTASRHGGQIQLPGGGAVPARLLSFAAPYDSPGGKRSFFVFSLPSVWRAAPHLKDQTNIDQLVRSVFVHEMTHTEHGYFHARLDELEKRLPKGEELDDDIIQNKFAANTEFSTMFEAEKALLYRAANARTKGEKRASARMALIDVVQRRSRFLRGENSVFGELEDVFLTMEGAANWAAYQSLIAGGMAEADAQAAIRRGGKYWSQDEGLALFLVIDALLPGWQRRAFADKNATAFEMLADAVE